MVLECAYKIDRWIYICLDMDGCRLDKVDAMKYYHILCFIVL